MKNTALLIIAIVASFIATPSAEAGQRYGCRPVQTYHCAPAYVCTKQICKRTECRYAYNHCGQRYAYHVVVITYADYYSNGSRRTYTRTYRA